VSVTQGDFLTALKIPLDARGPCHVRVFVEDQAGQRYALGARDIDITSPRTAALPVHASLQDKESPTPATRRGADVRR
jgi:hypothetical protein